MMNGLEGHGLGMSWWWFIGLIIVVAVVWMVVKSINTKRRTNLPSGKSAYKH